MANARSLNIEAVLAVLRCFSQLEGQKQPNETHSYGTVAASKIELSYKSRSPIPLLLPAAPFKNSSPLKVLDTKNPDFAEELGLARLDHLCNELAKVYRYGAELTIVSDGPVYNDLLCIPGSDFYDYGVKLRKIAADQEFTRIRFRRLADVLGIADGDSLPKDEYIALADTCRAEMEARFLPDQSEMKEKIENHKDTNLTYQAYVKLTDEDLRWGPDLDPAIKNNRERYTEETKKVAVKMTERLLAYERALEAAFPDHVRLSIHRSTGESKIPVPLIPQLDGFGFQPWHCCVVVTAQGRYVTGHFKDYQHNDNYEVILKDGRPFLVREKNDDFNWPEHIKLHHAYGGKVIVENTLLEDMELTTEWKVKLANLALRFKTVEVRGFQI